MISKELSVVKFQIFPRVLPSEAREKADALRSTK